MIRTAAATTPLDVEHTCHAGPYCEPHHAAEAVWIDQLGRQCHHESCAQMDWESCPGCYVTTMDEYMTQLEAEVSA